MSQIIPIAFYSTIDVHLTYLNKITYLITYLSAKSESDSLPVCHLIWLLVEWSPWRLGARRGKCASLPDDCEYVGRVKI